MNPIPPQTQEAVLLKVANGVQNGGAIAAAGSGAARILGYTADEWAVIGVIGGLVIAFIGMVVSQILTFYFKNAHLKLARAEHRADEGGS